MNTTAWSALLTVHWPELSARLGPRLDDFVAAARLKASQHQLQLDAAVARYVNMCFALGPNFEDKAHNEWALAILSNQALSEWAKVHQLVVRALAELRRRPGDGARAAEQLQRADTDFLDAHDALPRADDASALARVACDVDVLDIRLLELDWRQEYTLSQGLWTRVPVGAIPDALRIRAGEPLPRQLTALSHAAGAGPLVRLQVRQLMHAYCDQDRHPALSLTGPHGLVQWQGYPARSLSWEVAAHPAAAAPAGLGHLLLEETQAAVSLLNAQCCGLRDTGVPTGAFANWLWCYPADQYLFAFQRAVPLQAQWPRDAQAAAAPQPRTACTYERDGLPLATRAWQQGFDQDLSQQLLQGLDKLFTAWSAGLQNTSMQATVGLLQGQAALTWGWRESERGLGEPAWMRALGQLDLSQQCDLELSGELAQGVTRTRLRLVLKGMAPIARALAREDDQSPLLDAVLAMGTRWSMDFQLAFDPIAVDDGAMASSISGCTGQLSGEFGLRPRIQGGGGWQWFMRLQTTQVAATVAVHDPVLGQSRRTVVLLPAMPLLDWSLG